MQACIYIMASESGRLYVRFTPDLQRRVLEHGGGLVEGFTKKYRCMKLVYFEVGESMLGAIEREKQIKRWSRSKKERLIKTLNPGWLDLYQQTY